jgi:tetratricopeptide (TPR) repeat protein
MVPFPLLALVALAAAPSPQASDPVAQLVERAEAARHAGRLDDALRVLDQGAPEVLRHASPAGALRVRLQRARCTYYRSSLAGTPQDATIQALRQVVAQAEALADAVLLADARDQLGLALYARDFRKGDQAEARALFEQALAQRRAAPDTRRVSESLFHLGLTWENKQDPTAADKAKAVALHTESLALAEKAGLDVEAGYAVRHLAGHRQDAGDLDGALAGFERSLALREKAGYAIYYAPSLLAVGDVWKEKGDAAKARQYFERAKAEADRLGAARFRQMADEALKSLLPTPAPTR